jgi:hypothetical protein
MQTKVTLNIDKVIFELVQDYALRKGMTLDELLEYYMRIIMLNEQFTAQRKTSYANMALRNHAGIKKTDWGSFQQQIGKIKTSLPPDFEFNRDEANER